MSGILKACELAVRRAYLRWSEKPFNGELITAPRCVIPQQSPRILLLRQDRIGDVLCSTPVLQSLRQHFPTARIDMLLSINNIALEPLVRQWCDRVWCYRKTAASFLALTRALRRVRYDAAIDLMDNPSATSTLFLRALNVPVRIGIDKSNAWVYTHCVPLLDRSRYHYVERIAQLLLPLGIDPHSEQLRLHYPLSSEDIAAAAATLELERYPQRRGFVFVHLSSRHVPLQWSREHFEHALRRIREAVPEVVIGVGAAPSQQRDAQAIADAVGGFAVPPIAEFHSYARLLAFARLLISPDTSIIHVAAALGVPVVALYHQHDPSLMPWYPYGTRFRALVAQQTGSINAIPPAAVAEAALELLSEQSPAESVRIFAASNAQDQQR